MSDEPNMADSEMEGRTGAKPKKRLRTALKQRRFDLESEKRQLPHENEALDEDLVVLWQRKKRGPSKKQCAALAWEIAVLKRHKGDMRDEISRAESKLEQQAAMKQQVLDLEGVRNGLLEEKEADQDKLKQLCDKLEPETFKEMCLEKVNGIEKEIAALKSQKDALQEEIELAESRQERQDACAQFEAEKRAICCKNKALQDELEEINRKVKMEPQWSIDCEYFTELQFEMVELKRKTGALQEEIELAKSRQERQDAFKGRCAQFEAEKRAICCKNKALQDELEEINMKIEPQWSIEYFSELQIEMKGLTRKTGDLQGEVKQAKSKLEQQASIKQQILKLEDVKIGLREKKEAVQNELTQLFDKLRQQTSQKNACLELQAESRCVQDEIESIKRKISQTLKKLAQEKSWKHKLEVTQGLKRAFESEKEQLLKHMEKLEKELDMQQTAIIKYKLQLQQTDKLRSDNLHLQQDVDKLVTKTRNLKSALENDKDMAKKVSQVKAKNKQLRKVAWK